MNFTNTDCVRNMLFRHLIWELGDQVNWQVMDECSEVKLEVHEQIVPLKSKIKLEIKI